MNTLLAPTINISAAPAGEICEGIEAKFTASISNGGNAPLFQWQKNGKLVGGNSNIYTDSKIKNFDEIKCIV